MTDPDPGVEPWRDQTSAFDRVRSIATVVSSPRPASYIADEAHVAENTARDHLERLVEMNVLLKTDRDGTTMYAPDPLHTRIQTLRDLLDTHDRTALIELKADLQDRIETRREEYGVESPDQLRGRAAEADDAATTRDIAKAASDWELLRYRLSILEDAIENYTTYTRDFRASP